MQSQAKKAFGEHNPQAAHIYIDDNICAICCGTYEDDVALQTGDEWIQCNCGRWMHEDCVDANAGDIENTKICPICTD